MTLRAGRGPECRVHAALGLLYNTLPHYLSGLTQSVMGSSLPVRWPLLSYNRSDCYRILLFPGRLVAFYWAFSAAFSAFSPSSPRGLA